MLIGSESQTLAQGEARYSILGIRGYVLSDY